MVVYLYSYRCIRLISTFMYRIKKSTSLNTVLSISYIKHYDTDNTKFFKLQMVLGF